MVQLHDPTNLLSNTNPYKNPPTPQLLGAWALWVLPPEGSEDPQIQRAPQINRLEVARKLFRVSR